ncbi:hypothetical protein L1887_53520 [Cichorium endivia]|nr:hypothetical protein L1887_53520 [Cichorium endivia]
MAERPQLTSSLSNPGHARRSSETAEDRRQMRAFEIELGDDASRVCRRVQAGNGKADPKSTEVKQPRLQSRNSVLRCALFYSCARALHHDGAARAHASLLPRPFGYGSVHRRILPPLLLLLLHASCREPSLVQIAFA